MTTLERALADLVRVTKRGARVAVVAQEPMESFAFFLAAIQAVSPETGRLLQAAPPFPGHVNLRRLLESAGLKEVRIAEVAMESPFHSGRQLWDFSLSRFPDVVEVIAGLAEGQRAEAQEVLSSMLLERSAGGCALLTDTVHVAVGVK